jgi:ATP-binding cassette, subfamily C, bacterial CydC
VTHIQTLLAVGRRRYWKSLLFACTCAGVASASAVTLLALSGWFITAAAVAGTAGPAAAHMFNYLLPSAAIRLLAITRTVARYGERLTTHELALKVLAHIRPAVFRAIALGPAERALSMTQGETTARIVQDVNALEGQFFRVPAIWGLLAATLSGIGLIALSSVTAAISTLICLAALLAIARGLTAWLDTPARAIQREIGVLKGLIAETARAAAELRCYGMAEVAIQKIEDTSRALARAQRNYANRRSTLEFCLAAGTGLATATALVLAAPAGAALSALSALAAAMTVNAAGPLLQAWAQRSAIAEAHSRLNALFLDPDLSVSDGPEAVPRRAALELVAPTRVLIEPEERIAFIAPSGKGKTRLFEQLIAVRHRGREVAYIDGVDVALLPSSFLRATFAWCPQDAALLSGTVRDNLLLAREDASEALLWSVLTDVALDQRVQQLPQQLDSWIGENGERLSGGERRRLALARAYLSDAPWLLLDEPTEGLDANTERQVVQRLKARLDARGQGLLVASHRPALLAICNRVLDWA